jgi:transposase
MQPKTQRRVHGAEFKAQVLAECQMPGASVAAVALAHGLNVNLVRKWLVGRGIKRTGLAAPRTATRLSPAVEAAPDPSLHFLPVELATDAEASNEASASARSNIRVDLTRGGTRLSVRWPATEATACAAWLHELAAALKE